jgi:NhaP-type Na+/H+ or K+/H+ antiporter
MSAACVIRARCPAEEHLALSAAFGKLWLGAEVLLFVLVGAAVDVGYVLEAGPGVLLLIPAALAVRSAGVLLCLVRTPLNRKERLFCVIAYLPKATVQAAIGGIPLAMGLPCGDLVLSVAVTGILITAPLGALGIDRGKGYFLKTE